MKSEKNNLIIDQKPLPINPPTSFVTDIISLPSGESIGTVELEPSIFGAPVRVDMIHRVLVWILARRRKGTANTKGRGEKSGSTRKLFKQKGTGRARAGTIRATQRRGSGAAHGPHPRDWSYSLQKKVRYAALRSVLASKYARGEIFITSSYEIPTHKTKQLVPISIEKKWNESGVLFIHGAKKSYKNFILASRNLNFAQTGNLFLLNVYNILKRKYLVLDLTALSLIHQWLSL